VKRNFLAEWHFGTPNATPQGRLKISKAERIYSNKSMNKTKLLMLLKTIVLRTAMRRVNRIDLTCLNKSVTLLVRYFRRTSNRSLIMQRMNRAGRQHRIYMAIIAYDKKHKGGAITTAQVAKKVGLKSSTYLKNILRHMAEIGLLKAVQIQPFYDCGYFVDAWQLARYEQTKLPDHEIIINGKSCRMSEMEI
jgi:hypothetical protein